MIRGPQRKLSEVGGLRAALALLGLCFGVCAALGAGAAAEELFLDLTTPAVADAERAQTWGCVGGFLAGSSDGCMYIPPRPALRLQITQLTGDTFRVGDEVVCELRITNTGNGPILIPWSVDPSILRTPKCEWLAKTKGTVGVTLTLGLDLVDQQGYSELTVAHELFGISSEPATVRTLAPQESLRVKMAGRANVSDIQARRAKANLRLSLPQRFTVAGTLDWNDSAVFGAYSEVRSDNLLHVTISQR